MKDEQLREEGHGWADGKDKFWQVINLAEKAPIPRLAIYHAMKRIEESARLALLTELEGDLQKMKMTFNPIDNNETYVNVYNEALDEILSLITKKKNE